MEHADSTITLIGRCLMALIFIISGVGKLFGWEQTAAFMAAHGMPLVPVMLLGAILLEAVGGALLLAGYRTQIAALALAVFLIPTTVIFHPFWGVSGPEQQAQLINFLKNLAIIGGLLVLSVHGAGAFSADDYFAKGGRRRKST